MYKAEYERCVYMCMFMCVCVCVHLRANYFVIYLASDYELENSARPPETAKTRSSTQSRGDKAAISTKPSMRGVCVLIINPRCTNMYALFEEYVVKYK